MPEQHTFLYISLLLFCTTMFLLARFIRFMEEIPYVLTCSWLVRGCFCRCCCFLFFFFFSLPLIITLVAAYFLTAPRENCHVLLPTKYMIPLRFLSLALALSSVINVNVDIKTYLVEGKTRICCCCCFFPLKVRVAMRFTAKTRGCLKCKNSPWLTWRCGRTNGVRTIFLEPKFLGCVDNRNCREPIFFTHGSALDCKSERSV